MPSNTNANRSRRRETLSGAWEQTSRSTRKVQLWLKHNVLAAGKASSFPDDTEAKEARPSSGQVQSVDQALQALSFYRDEFPIQSDYEEEFDWILDGHADWQIARRRTHQLLEQLSTSHIDNEQWVLQLGMIGQQEYQFAAFGQGDDTFSPATKESSEETGSVDSTFGDFQGAQRENSTTVEDPSIHIAIRATDSEADEFGDFQEANEGQTTTPGGEQDSVAVSTSSPSNTQDIHPEKMSGTKTLIDQSVVAKEPVRDLQVSASFDLARVNAASPDVESAKQTTCNQSSSPSGGNHLVASIEEKYEPATYSTPSKDKPTTPKPTIYSTPRSGNKTEPKTPTTNNYSQTKQTPHQFSLSSPFIPGDPTMNEHELTPHGEVEDDTHSESVTTEPSLLSSGIPAVVQLFPKQPPSQKSHLAIPSSVDLAHKDKQSSKNKTMNNSTRKPLPVPLNMALQLERETSIASQSTIASPEGRFFRRTSQMFRSDDGSEGSNSDTAHSRQDSLGSLRSFLPENYWRNPEYDDTVDVMQSLEWDWIPYWRLDNLLQTDGCDESYVPLWLEQITQKLSELDSIHLKTCKKLYKLIQPHAEELELANRSALDLAKHLQLCKMYLERTQTSIQMAKFGFPQEKSDQSEGMGVEGARQLLSFWDTQESYIGLDSILREVEALYALETELVQRIKEYDVLDEGESLTECRAILNLAQGLQDRLLDPSVSQLQCLSPLRDRASLVRSQTFVAHLQKLLEATTVRCCHPQSTNGGFDPVAYGRLVEAMLLTEQPRDAAGVNQFVKSFCSSLHTALLLEAQKSFGMALLNPSDSENEDSDYDRELLALSTNAYMNPERMGVWTANLVTIRFDFERDKHLLPAIYHKLCWLLTNVLHGHYCLLTWHQQQLAKDGKGSAGILDAIFDEMKIRKPSIWNACVKALEECLEEYYRLSSTKKLFRWIDEEFDDTAWRRDLSGLEDVLRLTNQFLTLRKEMLVDVSEKLINDGSMLRETFYNIQKKHLRTVHVEAMNTTGQTLSREDWVMVPLPHTLSQNPESATMDIITEAISMQILKCKQSFEAVEHSKNNQFSGDGGVDSHLRNFLYKGNPFEARIKDPLPSREIQSPCQKLDTQISTLLQSFLGDSEATSPMVPACFVDTIFPWISRLLVLLEKLPPITPDICNVVSNVSNLYITTAFRICAGSSTHEMLLLGLQTPTFTAPSTFAPMNARIVTTPLFGFNRKTSQQNKPQVTPIVPTATDAEIVSPLPRDSEQLARVAEFISSAQDDLKSIAKLDLVDGWVQDPDLAETDLSELTSKAAIVLEKRQAASWGCSFLAATLQLAALSARESFVYNSGEQYGVTLEILETYVAKLTTVASEIVRAANRISCVRAIRGKFIVQQILNVGSSWEESKLHENPSHYVDTLCDYYALLWSSLWSSTKLPSGAMEMTWSQLVENGFSSILNGFARVPFCSTEGRALMSMDLASFSSGVSGRSILERLEGQVNVPKPPMVSSAEFMGYVDTYIKVFYFPPSDAMNWIESNYQNYREHHMVALIVGAAVSSGQNQTTIQGYADQVKALYIKHSELVDAGNTVKEP